MLGKPGRDLINQFSDGVAEQWLRGDTMRITQSHFSGEILPSA